MQRNDLAALAKGLAPFVRDCVAEATAVPPELAEQIASAVRMLHESPAIAAKQIPAVAGSRVTRIERDADGNFVPVYDQPV